MYEDQKGIECWRPARLGDSPRVTQCWRQTIRTRFWVKGSLTTSPRASFHGVPAPTRYLVLLENHQAPPLLSRWPKSSPRNKSGRHFCRYLQWAKHGARWAVHVIYKGHNLLRGCSHCSHFTDGKV